MAAEKKRCGFFLLRVHLGARQEFEMLADPGVNTLDRDADYSGRTTDGTAPDVFVQVLAKVAAAIGSGDSRVELEIDGSRIVG
jgi:hypothetical protein